MADRGNSAVRRFASDGSVTTVGVPQPRMSAFAPARPFPLFCPPPLPVANSLRRRPPPTLQALDLSSNAFWRSYPNAAPSDICFDPSNDNAMYWGQNFAIYSSLPSNPPGAWGPPVLVAGTPGTLGQSDASPATFGVVAACAVDPGSGNVLVLDASAHTLRCVARGDGSVTTLVAASFRAPGVGGMAFDPNNWNRILITVGHLPRSGLSDSVLALDAANGYAVSVVAGLNTTFFADGPATRGAAFSSPAGVAVDAAGNIYVADAGNSRVRRISAAGVVATLAGSVAGAGYADGAGSAARLQAPTGIAVDGSGVVYVADYGNNVIRKITKP